jgi:hypothetical protein
MSSLPIRPIFASILSGSGAAVVAAMILAIIDLYLTGHSMPALGRPWLTVFGGAITISRAELLFYLAIVAGGWAGWLQASRNP